MVEFEYQEMFPLGEDTTEYRILTDDHVSVDAFKGAEMLTVAPDGLPFWLNRRSRTSHTC